MVQMQNGIVQHEISTEYTAMQRDAWTYKENIIQLDIVRLWKKR